MFDVLPERLRDGRPALGVDAEQPGQPRVQFELRRLGVEQQQNRTAHTAVTRSLHLRGEGS